jgi:hypothetical protein
MTNYAIPQYPTTRLRYFNNQFLNEQDFVDSDAYAIATSQAMSRALCVAGVLEGFTVSYPDPARPPSLAPGTAVDANGQLITSDQALDGPAPATLADGTYALYVSFGENVTLKATGQGAADFRRFVQAPAFTAVPVATAAAAGAICVGQCKVAAGAVSGGTTVGRQFSGLRLPTPGGGIALASTGATADGATLFGTLTVQRNGGAGQLGPIVALTTPAGGKGAGGAIDFNGYDVAGNDATARVQSQDDGASSSHLVFHTKQPGAVTNHLVERVRLTSAGLLQFPAVTSDKLVLFDDGTGANRYGLGVNAGNLNVFCPPNGHFSLRQLNAGGAEVFTVSGTGVGKFSSSLTVAGNLAVQTGLIVSGTSQFAGAVSMPDTFISSTLSVNLGSGSGAFTVRRDVAGQLGPSILLLNAAGAAGAGGSIDFDGYNPVAGTLPTLRVQSLDDGNFSSHLAIQTKVSGAAANGIVERFRITSNGDVNLHGKHAFRTTDPWLRLNQDGAFTSGTHTPGLFAPGALNVGGVNGWGNPGGGNAWVAGSLQMFGGAIIPRVGNSGAAGIQFPTDPGGGGGDEAFLRYSVIGGETTQLILGISNDADDQLVLWQNGLSRLVIVNNSIVLNFNQGHWVFQSDGNLVKYRNDGHVLWNSGAGW